MKTAHRIRKITLEFFVIALLIKEIFEYQNTIKEFFPVVYKNASATFIEKFKVNKCFLM